MKWCAMEIDQLTPEQYGAVYEAMPPEQRKRVEDLRFAEDRKRTLAAQLLARRMVARWCELEEAGIVFARSENGKPYPVGLPVDFSVSHCEKLVVCAVDDQPVGIDVERLRPINLRIAKKICSPEELRYLFGKEPTEADLSYTEDPVLTERFFRLWTGKEACAKRLGQGIGSLHRFRPLEEALQYERIGDYLIGITTESK